VAEYPAAPDYRHLLARCYRDLAGAPFAGDPQSSRDSLSKATAILEKLAVDFADVPDYRYDLSKTYAMVDFPPLFFFPFPGSQDETAKQRWREAAKTAEERLRKALEISEQLVAEHPNVPDYAVSQVQIQLRLGDLLRPGDQDQKDAAEKCLRSALALQSSLVRRFPQNASYQVLLLFVRGSLADLLRERGELPEARSLLEASVKVLKDLVQKEPRQVHLRGVLLGNYLGLANVLRQMGEEQAAEEALRQAGQLGPWGPGEKQGPREPPHGP